MSFTKSGPLLLFGLSSLSPLNVLTLLFNICIFIFFFASGLSCPPALLSRLAKFQCTVQPLKDFQQVFWPIVKKLFCLFQQYFLEVMKSILQQLKELFFA